MAAPLSTSSATGSAIISWDAMTRMPPFIFVWILLVVAAVAFFNGVTAFSFPVSAKQRSVSASATTTTTTTTSTQLHHSKKKNPLDACIAEGLQAGAPTILIVDTNNVRGKDDFKTWNCDLLTSLACYRRQHLQQAEIVATDKSNSNPAQLQIIYAMDHGCRPSVYDYADGLIVFAGPHRTADDVIAQATRFFAPTDLDRAEDDSSTKSTQQQLQVVVVTSDGELKQRCLRCAQPPSLGGKGKRRKRPKSDFVSVKVFGSPSLVSSLKDINVDAKVDVEPADSPSDISSWDSPNSLPTWFINEMERVESDVRWYTSLHPPFKSGKEQVEAREHGPWKSTLLQQPASTETTSIFPRKLFQEETWHRVLAAEMMQRLLQRWQQQQRAGDESSSREKTEQLILSDYTSFYNQHQQDNKSGAPVDTMFLDHRICKVPHLQEYLLKYLQTSLVSLTNGGGSATSKAKEPLLDNIPHLKSPAELAVEFMQQLVQESPNKTQDEILARYIKEAPYNLHSSRRQDLVNLLKQIAVREKRQDDHRPRWYLIELEGAELQDWTFQPSRGRRSEKRRRSLLEQSTQIDDELVAAGKSIEEKWLEQVEWYAPETMA